MLRQFVGPEQAVSGLGNAEFGSLAVVLRNGQIDRVVHRGKRFARGWRAPLMGNLSVVQVNAGLIGLKITTRDIPTADPYEIRAVRLGVQVQIDDAHGYEAFSDLVRSTGPTFGMALVAHTENGIDAMVRGRLAVATHEALYGAALAGYLGADQVPFPLGGDVIVLRSLVVEEVLWDENFRAVRSAPARSNVVVAETGIEVARQQQDATVYAARIEAFGPLASQLGIDPAVLADGPERRMLLDAQRFELSMKLLDPANRALLQRNPVFLAALEAAITPAMARPAVVVAPAQVAIPSQQQPTVSWLEQPPDGPSAPATPVIDVSPTKISYTKGPRTRPGPDPARSAFVPPPTADLTVDQRLARVWRSLGLPEHTLDGLGGATAGGRGAVLAVTDPVLPAHLLTAAPELLAQVLRVDTVSVIGLRSSSVEELVDSWVRAALGHSSVAGLSLSVSEEKDRGLDRLVIRVAGEGGVRQVVRALTDPESPALAALESVLPYAAVDVQPVVR